mmetsp:Transcript_108475/g.317361  ORF Transcript_108475/g.317361 Transcript_108475/m.317361 type:complete len:246 (-) Transcript_108475:8-745(-)
MPVLVVDVACALGGVDVAEEAHLRQDVRSAEQLPHPAADSVSDGVVHADLLAGEVHLLELHELVQQHELLLVGDGALVEVYDAGRACATTPSLCHEPLYQAPQHLHLCGGGQAVDHVPGAALRGHALVGLGVGLPPDAAHAPPQRRLAQALLCRGPEPCGRQLRQLLRGGGRLPLLWRWGLCAPRCSSVAVCHESRGHAAGSGNTGPTRERPAARSPHLLPRRRTGGGRLLLSCHDLSRPSTHPP